MNLHDIQNDIAEVLVPAEKIQTRVRELGAQISADYAGQDLLMVGVLRGVFIFMADLVRAITIPVDVDFICIAGYDPTSRERGVVRFTKDLKNSIEGRQVLFVEDVVDTGLTLRYILRNLAARHPASIHVCTLFDRPRARLFDLELRYIGFTLPDRFVVGYGLDYAQQYRNLPFVGVLKEECITRRRLPESPFHQTSRRPGNLREADVTF